MIKKYSGVCLAICLMILAAGCSNLPDAQATTTSAVIENTPTASSPTPTEESTDTPTIINLMIWLPPQFDPEAESHAGILLQERLDAFNSLYPNLNVNFRIKSETGNASLLQSLHTASEAAPLVLPDLVLISHADLYTAAADQLIYPYPVPLTPEEDQDWYPLAYTLSEYQDQTFFLPLAADALLAVYTPTENETFPSSWGDLMLENKSISFPPADPQAYSTIAFYTAEANFYDEDGNISVDKEALTRIFEFYANLHAANLLPPNPAQIDTDENAWDQFITGQSSIAITWTSRYFDANVAAYRAAPLPSSDGNPFSMAKSWGWAITTPDPNEQAAAAELARFLSAAEFTGPWTEAAALLPLRPTAITLWENPQHRSIAEQLLPVVRAAPHPKVFSTISTPLTDAVLDVLTDVQTPTEAANTVINTLGD